MKIKMIAALAAALALILMIRARWATPVFVQYSARVPSAALAKNAGAMAFAITPSDIPSVQGARAKAQAPLTAGGPMTFAGTLRSQAPTVDTLRAEVQANPHQTPLSLLQFAGALADHMEIAEQSEDQASRFLTELEDCVTDDRQAQTTQALCLTNAERLGEKFPALNSKITALNQRAPPEVSKLLSR